MKEFKIRNSTLSSEYKKFKNPFNCTTVGIETYFTYVVAGADTSHYTITKVNKFSDE